jgi:glucosamine 6-phosphate synthetase-like amidotransferase/phosphosugar isomerase protein
LTKILLPIKEGEFAMFTPADLQLFEVKTGKKLKREFQRCLLKVEETRLQAPHRYFMEQEIAHQIPATRRLATLFTGGNSIVKWLRAQKSHAPLIKSIREYITSLAEMTDSKKLQSSFQKFLSSREAKELLYICATFDTEGLDLTLDS